MSDTWEGWHFLRQDGCLNYLPHTKVEVGQTLIAEDKPLELCNYGLHASKRAIDALNYAPGNIICRVQLGGKIIEGDDKACATKRTVLWMADATKTLHYFACWCAEEALNRARKSGMLVDSRSERAIEVKRLWLEGKATYDELAAARDAARDAAGDAAGAAARAAARDAARDAAWAAARDAVRYAAGAAARDAARAAARAAVRAAAWDAVRYAAWAAARNAARDAARDAAGDAQNEMLEKMLFDLQP